MSLYQAKLEETHPLLEGPQRSSSKVVILVHPHANKSTFECSSNSTVSVRLADVMTSLKAV